MAEQRVQLRIPLSVSIGVASVDATASGDDTDVLALADRALYGAKTSGRGRALVVNAPRAALRLCQA